MNKSTRRDFVQQAAVLTGGVAAAFTESVGSKTFEERSQTRFHLSRRLDKSRRVASNRSDTQKNALAFLIWEPPAGPAPSA